MIVDEHDDPAVPRLAVSVTNTRGTKHNLKDAVPLSVVMTGTAADEDDSEKQCQASKSHGRSLTGL